MKDIINYNSKQQPHGYQELYVGNKLLSIGNWINNKPIGYTEYHFSKKTNFYII